MIDSVYDDARERMSHSIDALKQEFKKLRTGRASVALFEGIKVSYYGTLTPLNQVASLSVPESRLIVIQPWDQTVIGEIEKEILKSELGLVGLETRALLARRTRIARSVDRVCGSDSCWVDSVPTTDLPIGRSIKVAGTRRVPSATAPAT